MKYPSKRALAMIPPGLILWVFAVSLSCLFSFSCLADEIQFQNQQGIQHGVVVGQDEQSVVIRFPREAIKSISRDENESPEPSSDKVIWEMGKDYLTLKIPRGNIQFNPQGPSKVATAAGTESLSPGLSQISEKGTVEEEQKPRGLEKAEVKDTHAFQKDMNVQQRMLQEEMGRVEGVIMWKGNPLQNSQVKIILERYTGFSEAALKKFEVDEGSSSENEIVLKTTTDSKGHYGFNEAPPGYYRLYWKPDEITGFVHRLREDPDLEVISGNLTTLDIPGKK